MPRYYGQHPDDESLEDEEDFPDVTDDCEPDEPDYDDGPSADYVYDPIRRGDGIFE